MSDYTRTDLHEFRLEMREQHRDLRVDLQHGLHAIEEQLRILNGRVRTAEAHIAVLQDRSQTMVQGTRATAAKWGAGVGALLAALLELAARWTTR